MPGWPQGLRAGQKSLVPWGRGVVTTSSPLWAAVSESRARLVNAFWEELPLPTLSVPCGGAALGSASPGPGERRPGRGMWNTLDGGAGAGVGTGAAVHREPVGLRRLAPAAREPEAFAICTALGGWGTQCGASSAPRFPGLFCSCGV